MKNDKSMWANDNWREYIFEVRRGNYDVKIQFPSHVLKKTQKTRRVKALWPMNNSSIFNALPDYIRNRVGQKCFSSLAKRYYDNVCQHPGNLDECESCQIPAYKNPNPIPALQFSLSEIDRLMVDILLFDKKYYNLKSLNPEIRSVVENRMYQLYGILIE